MMKLTPAHDFSINPASGPVTVGMMTQLSLENDPMWSGVWTHTGKPSFVSVGDEVAAGQTLLIIEAMKTFNPIKARKAGKVTRILVENAQPVEYDEPLMVVE